MIFKKHANKTKLNPVFYQQGSFRQSLFYKRLVKTEALFEPISHKNDR